MNHLSPLIVAQKKAVRIVASQPPLSHTDPIFSRLKLLKLTDHYKYNLGIYMWKNIDRFAPYLRININNTRSGDYYAPNRQRLTLNQRQSIKSQAPMIWEDIPLNVRNSTSIVSFKNKYKNSLLSCYDIQSSDRS